MSRQVTHDGNGAFQVRFPFDRVLVDRIKTLPRRRWNAGERYWWVPDSDIVQLVDLLGPEQFRFDAATVGLYAQAGGTAELAQAAEAHPPRLPGLFDPAPGEPADRAESTGDDFTVESLNRSVRAAIDGAFPQPIWLVGEVSGFNKNSHRRHVSFELAERDANGATVSKVPATLFESTRKTVEETLRRAGDPFRLEDEVTIRARVRVELYVPWGQYRVVVVDLDVNYTLGEAARRREEIVRRLTESGLLERNRSLPWPTLPLRVGLITSLGSDAYNDVLQTLEESGFAFRVTAHGARVQGRATEPSVLNALDWFDGRADEFDLVLICRGGGSRTDLVWFDSEPLGRAVAGFPLPIVVGIGHEQDQSVLDAVARSCKTPTAAARLLVDEVRHSAERVEVSIREIVVAARRATVVQDQLSRERATRLARATRILLQHETTRLAHRQRRAALGAGVRLDHSRRQLNRWTGLIPRGASLHLERRRVLLAGNLSALLREARRLSCEARERLERSGRRLRPGGARRIALELERTAARERRVHLVDPRRVLDRGYAILRTSEGGLIRRAVDAPAGSLLRARLQAGVLRLRSEGQDPEGGD